MKKPMPFLALAFFFIASLAQAGHSVGNGADAVLDGDRALLLDLVEAGIADTAETGFGFFPKPKLAAAIRRSIDRTFASRPLAPETREALAMKFDELLSTDEVAAFALLQALSVYRFSWVEAELGDVADEDINIIVPREKLKQAAVRRNQSILIQRVIWEKMPPIHQAALLVHEAIYSVIRPVRAGSLADGTPLYKQESPMVRQIVADLFQPAARLGPIFSSGSRFGRYRTLEGPALPFGEPGYGGYVARHEVFDMNGMPMLDAGVTLRVVPQWGDTPTPESQGLHFADVTPENPVLGADSIEAMLADRVGSPAYATAHAYRAVCEAWMTHFTGTPRASPSAFRVDFLDARTIRYRFDSYLSPNGSLGWLSVESSADELAAFPWKNLPPVMAVPGEACEATLFRAVKAWLSE